MKKYLIEEMENARLITVRNNLIFIWRGYHTVNVFHAPTEMEIDAFSIGNFANDITTYDDFYNGIKAYLRDRGEW